MQHIRAHTRTHTTHTAKLDKICARQRQMGKVAGQLMASGRGSNGVAGEGGKL